MEAAPTLNGGFTASSKMQHALGNKQQSWGRRIRFHCNQVVGAAPVDMTKDADAALVFAAKHFFKYASGVYGTRRAWAGRSTHAP